MKNLIAGNWKMNPNSLKEARDIFEGIKKGIAAASAKGSGEPTEVVICPPAVYLPELRGLALGGQDIYFEEKGAFTGEISGSMLKDLGVEYVIIGHSERRKYFGETDELVNKKIKKALEIGLKVIFCIGETAEERDAGKKNEVLQRQLEVGLAEIENLENINIAYEPVWAIGTGNNCGVDETKESINFIKSIVRQEVRVIYGGSVKSENSGEYIKFAGANGLLVGGASLNAEEFVKIVKSAE